MRVLHLGKFYPPVAGGIERFTQALAQQQAALGLRPAVLAHSPTPRSSDWNEHTSVATAFARSYGQFLFVPLSPAWPVQFLRCLRRWQPQLLHLHLPNPAAFFLLFSPAARRLPWVVHWHSDVSGGVEHPGVRLAYPLYRQFETALLRRATRIIATSHRYAGASTALRPWNDRVRVIPLGLTATAVAAGRSPSWPSTTGLKLLAVGRLSYYKGFDVLIEALARCPQAQLLLIGSGDQESRLRALIAARGLESRVALCGAVDDSSLEAAYRDCDVFCLPSIDRSEAFGMVLLEAMRAGKPVIASDIPGSGVGEVVARDDSGELIAVGDVDALAQAIARLAFDAALRARMGSAGRSRFAQHYQIEPVAAAISAVYAEALASAAGPD